MTSLGPERSSRTDPAPARVAVGNVPIDPVGMGEALARIDALVDEARGGTVFTPNVDHVVSADSDERFRAAYDRASLSLVDGQPLRWAAAWLGTPLPEKLSGSDLLVPIARRAAARGLRVYILGGAPGVAERAASILRRDHGANVVGADAPAISLLGDDAERDVVARIRGTRPHLLLVALGSPKQELFLDRNREALAPAVGIAIGASLDFLVGRVRRAPRWMQRGGLEWAFRLVQEPRRLARRYLLRDPRFLAIVWRALRERRRAPAGRP